jgi:hypothetical protein
MARSRTVQVLFVGLAGGSLAIGACVGDDPTTSPSLVAPDAAPDVASGNNADGGTVTPSDSGGAADTGPSCNVSIPSDPSQPGAGLCPGVDGGPATQCPSGQMCCESAGGSYPWICTSNNFDCIEYTQIGCNSPGDCPAAKCCLIAAVTPGCPAAIDLTTIPSFDNKVRYTACGANCAGDQHVVCLGDTDCPTGKFCHPAQVTYDGTNATTIIGVCD